MKNDNFKKLSEKRMKFTLALNRYDSNPTSSGGGKKALTKWKPPLRSKTEAVWRP